MTAPKVVLRYRNLTVEVESTPGEELLEHMHTTVMGQPGGLRYLHTNLADRLLSPGENYFMYLRKSGKMLGSVGFLCKDTETAGFRHDSWLIRYFSIKAPMRSVPVKRKERADPTDESRQASVLGRFIQPVFAEPSQLREHGDAESPAIIYAIIEQKNLRSMNFSTRMGLETVGVVAGFSFSRLNPRRSDRMEQLAQHEQDAMLVLLKAYYKSYTLFFPDPLFKNDDYYVIKEAGRIVAGLQIYRVTWRILDFGGGLANSVIRLLTRFPGVKKRLNPGAMHLLAFDGIYCETGYETALYELMEGVLESTGTYMGMLMMDNSSGLFRIFSENRKLGPVHRVIGTFYADVRVRFIHTPEPVRRYFLDHPTYIPTYDNA